MKKILLFIAMCFALFACKHDKTEKETSQNSKQLEIYRATAGAELKSCYLICEYRDNEKRIFLNEALQVGKREYTANIPFLAKNIRLEAIANNENANVVILEANPKILAEETGSIQNINFMVILGDSSSTLYSIKAIRQDVNTDTSIASIKAIFNLNNKLQTKDLSNSIVQDSTSFTATVPFLARSIALQIETASPATTISITKTPDDMGIAEGDIQEFNIKVIAESGTEKLYKMQCVREGKSSNSYLKALNLFADGASIELSPSFSKEQKEYSAIVPCLASFLHPVAISESASSIIKEITYQPLNFKSVPGAEQKIFIKVQAEDNSSSIYAITMKRAEQSNNASLSSITVNDITIPCKEACFEYHLDLAYSNLNTKLKAKAQHSSAKVHCFPDFQTLLTPGTNKIEFLVIAENKDEKRYTLFLHVEEPEFKMIKMEIDSPISFPKGKLNESTQLVEDSETAIIDHSFELANYELSYTEWREVFMWALENGYSFDRAGVAGSHGAKEIDQGIARPLKPAPLEEKTKYHPVTQITWRDAIVWCNAKNEKEGLPPVYYYNGEVLKSAIMPTEETKESEKPDYVCDEAEVKDEGGYRLPTEVEWEFAARLTNSKLNAVQGAECALRGSDAKLYFTKGDSACAALLSCKHVEKDSNDEFVLTGARETQRVAVFKWFFNGETNAEDASVAGTAPIGTKDASFMQFYDMTGNVEEFCFDNDYSIYRARRGGAWTMGPKNLQLGLHESGTSAFGDYKTGFRLARTLK